MIVTGARDCRLFGRGRAADRPEELGLERQIETIAKGSLGMQEDK